MPKYEIIVTVKLLLVIFVRSLAIEMVNCFLLAGSKEQQTKTVKAGLMEYEKPCKIKAKILV